MREQVAETSGYVCRQKSERCVCRPLFQLKSLLLIGEVEGERLRGSTRPKRISERPQPQRRRRDLSFPSANRRIATPERSWLKGWRFRKANIIMIHPISKTRVGEKAQFEQQLKTGPAGAVSLDGAAEQSRQPRRAGGRRSSEAPR